MTLKREKSKRLISLLIAAAMIVCMICVAIVPASAVGNEAVREDTNGVLQIRTYIYVSGEQTIQGTTTKVNHTNLFTIMSGFNNQYDNYYFGTGTAFLINDDTVLTCAHVVNETMWNETEDEEQLVQAMNALRNQGFTVDLEYKVVVNKDVTIPCTVVSQSVQDDYAILKLSQPLGGKKPLTLAKSDDLSTTQTVYSLGFPGAITRVELSYEGKIPALKWLDDNRKYDSDDVTISDGSIQKLTSLNNTKVIQHGASILGGNSGGPLVDDNGHVVGVNKWGLAASEGYYWATSIDEVKKALDGLNIAYTNSDGSSPTDASDETEAPKETTIEETKGEIETVEPTQAPEPPKPGTNWPLIIGIIAGVILLIAVIVIVIVLVTKKNNNNGSGNQPPTPPAPPMPPTPPMPPMNDGAGETSVLSDGAGETTVLGGGATGFCLIRKSNNEKITINKPEFVIGKERRRVDYCISDNNSVSRAHAKVRVRSSKCYITDLGSTNCTYVNGVKLSPNQEIELKSGDKIKISDVEFEFNG